MDQKWSWEKVRRRKIVRAVLGVTPASDITHKTTILMECLIWTRQGKFWAQIKPRIRDGEPHNCGKEALSMIQQIQSISTFLRANLGCQTSLEVWSKRIKTPQETIPYKTSINRLPWRSQAWVWPTKILIYPNQTFLCRCFRDLWWKSRPAWEMHLQQAELLQMLIILQRLLPLKKLKLWRRRIDLAQQPWSTNLPRM